MNLSELPLVCPTAVAIDVFKPVIVSPLSVSSHASTSATGPASRTTFTTPLQSITPQFSSLKTDTRETHTQDVLTPPSSLSDNQTVIALSAKVGANLYCGLCKKKFSNEATYKGHESSAKHKKEAKAAAVKMTAAAKQAQSARDRQGDRQTNIRSEPRVHTPPPPIDDEVLAEAIFHQSQAQQVENTDALLAITLYWKAGTAFAHKQHTRDTVMCLSRLIQLAGSPQLTGKVPKHVINEAQLLLARSLYHYNPVMAGEYYCQALIRYFSLSILQTLEELWDDLPELLCRCQTVYEGLISRISQRKTLTEDGDSARANLHSNVHSLLQETIGCLARNIASPAAIILTALDWAAVTVNKEWEDSLVATPIPAMHSPVLPCISSDISNIHRSLGKMYLALDCDWWAIDCMHSSWLTGNQTNSTLLLESLVLALKLGDEGRCKILERQIKTTTSRDQSTGSRDQVCYQLAQLSEAMRRGDWQLVHGFRHRVTSTWPGYLKDVYQLCVKRAVFQ